jgi:hypothetical protein
MSVHLSLTRGTLRHRNTVIQENERSADLRLIAVTRNQKIPLVSLCGDVNSPQTPQREEPDRPPKSLARGSRHFSTANGPTEL